MVARRRRAVVFGLALAGALGLACGAMAGEPLPQGTPVELSLPAVIRQAVERNPGLQAARARWQAAVEKYPQALALPDPMLEYRYDGTVDEHRVGASQVVPPPPMILAESRMALTEAHLARLGYDIALRDLIVETKVSFFELAYLESAIAITRQNQELLQHIAQVAAARYAQNQTTLNDVLKAQAQAAQLDYDLVLLHELQDTERVGLTTLLAMPSGTPFGPAAVVPLEPLELTPDEVEQRALQNRQEIAQMAAEARKAGLAVDLAKSKWWPEVKVMVTAVAATDMEPPPESEDALMVEVSVSIPLDVRKKRAGVREAVAARAAAEDDLRSLNDETRAMVRKAYFSARNAMRLIELYEKTLIPQAKQAMQIAEAWNTDREKNFSGLLETQSTWLNFNLARLRAMADYQQSLARLERLAGGLLVPAQPKEGTP
jgi:outer membrane protein, heavy metal efflux system